MRDVPTPGALDEVPSYVDATAPAVEKELRDLRALPAPDDERIEEFVRKVEQVLQSSRDVAEAARRGHEAEARTAGQRTQALTREARALARELGADRCAAQ